MDNSRSFVDFTDDDEGEVIQMANNFLHVMSVTGSEDSVIPASALGYALAVLMSHTPSPEDTFSAALNARDRQWKRLTHIEERLQQIRYQ